MKVAIVQDGPDYLNAEFTLSKTADYILRAAREKAQLIVFGENWFSGYPIWLDICNDVNLWDHAPVKSVWSKMFDQGLACDSDLMMQLVKIIKEAGIYVIMGANEPITQGKGNGTLYNTIYTFDQNGNIINHHRKLMPTYTEKLVHGIGDGAGLNAIQTDFGRIGSLICWEHWMPLTRQAMHDEGEDLHIALWPYAKELHQIASRHYAHEGRCFVIAVGQIMHQDEIPKELTISSLVELDASGLIMKGGCSIYGPDGGVILPPIYNTRELILADLPLEKVTGERMNLSVSGHYQRNDVFALHVNKSRKT